MPFSGLRILAPGKNRLQGFRLGIRITNSFLPFAFTGVPQAAARSRHQTQTQQVLCRDDGLVPGGGCW